MRTTVVSLRSPVSAGPGAGVELAATLYLPNRLCRSLPGGGGTPEAPPRAPGLIVGHGAGSQRARHDEFCREACLQGFVVLAIDFRGHGESAGVADGPLEQDVLAAAEFLRRRSDVDGAFICYRGSSMGGFYGLKAAATGADLTALALLCPASEHVILDALSDTDEGQADTESPGVGADIAAAPQTRWDVPRLRAYFEGQDSLALATRVHRPVLLVHARGDDVVPFEHSLALASRLGGDATLLALSGGSHSSAQHDPRVHRLTARWLLDQVTSACTGRT